MVLCRYCNIRMDYSFYAFGLYVLFVCPRCGHSCSRLSVERFFGEDVDKVDVSRVDEKGLVLRSGIKIRKEVSKKKEV